MIRLARRAAAPSRAPRPASGAVRIPARYRFAALLLPVLAGGLAACSNDGPANEVAVPRVDAAPAPVVTVARTTRQRVTASVPVSGTLVAREEVLVSAQVPGVTIERLLADVGDRVVAGDPLAELDRRTLETQLARSDADIRRAAASVAQASSQIDAARASLVQAQASLERSRLLRRSGTIPASALDQASAAEASARAALASAEDGLSIARAERTQLEAARRDARLSLERTRIVAPVDGIVATRGARRGAITSSGGEPLFVLIANGEVELEAEVIETDLADVDVGDAARISVAGGGTLDGEVRLVPSRVDPRTRLGIVRIALDVPASGRALRPGFFASGRIDTVTRESLVVPATAVQSSTDGDAVTVVANGVVEHRAVVAGMASGERREILSGLAAGERVLVKAGAFFHDGDEVTPVVADEGIARVDGGADAGVDARVGGVAR